jgi:uncharacterized protein YdeI (YjbR/CyaY-like superfamily)
MDTLFFRSGDELRAWLLRNSVASELWVGFFKKSAAETGISYAQAVDEALCAGWIDGVRQTVDRDRYRIRFTPRRSGSNWSAVNIRRCEELLAAGRMLPAGQAAFAARKHAKSRQYSYENRPKELGEPYEQQFRQHVEAWTFYVAQPPSYQRTATWFVLSAKQETTRQRRLAALIEASAHGERLAAISSKKR